MRVEYFFFNPQTAAKHLLAFLFYLLVGMGLYQTVRKLTIGKRYLKMSAVIELLGW